VCEIVSGEPQIREPEKCIEIGWFDVDRVPDKLTQVTQTNLKNYRQLLETKK
jgi:hypothetical protein